MTEEEIRKKLAGRAAEYHMFKDDDPAMAEQAVGSSVILFPEFQKLKDEVERMRTELSMLLLERDELQFVISKNLSTAYMLEFGSLEYKAYEAQCTALRLKRKIELIQAKLNRQEKINPAKIEETLDREFAEYQAKLEEQINKMNEAIERSKLPALSEKETKEIKQIYRSVVKSLHPDLNPNVSPAQVKLFENAVEAYKNGDISTLRIIKEMVVEHNLPEKEKDSLSVLRDKQAELTKLIKTIQEHITRIKGEYPFTIREIINNPEKKEARKVELEEITAQYAGLIEFYTAKIKEMMG